MTSRCRASLIALLLAIVPAACAPRPALRLPSPPREVVKETAPRAAPPGEGPVMPATSPPESPPAPQAVPPSGPAASPPAASVPAGPPSPKSVPSPSSPPPPDPGALYARAIARTKESIARGAPAEAVPYWQRLEGSPWEGDALFHQGVLLQLSGDFDGAEARYRKASERTPAHARAAANLLGVLVMRGKVAEALPLAERALADPASAEGAPELLANAAAAFLEVGRIEAADGLLRILAEKAPRTASLSWNLAVLAWRRGDVAGARARASAIPPPMASLWPVVASRFAWDRGQVAIPDSGGLSRAEPRVAALSRNLEAWARFREGNAGAAERIISPLASQDAFPAELATNLGIVQAEQGKWSEAQANLERAVRARPDLAEGWLNLGLFLDIYRGEAAGARDCYEKYVRLNGVRKEEVRKWIERLDRSAPQRPPSP